MDGLLYILPTIVIISMAIILIHNYLKQIYVMILCEQKECPICYELMPQFDTFLDRLTNFELIRILNCGHSFHSLCINNWLKNAKTCPICRAKN